MSGSAIYKFYPDQQTFETNSAMQATSSLTLLTGYIYFSQQSGYYSFDTSILNIGTFDLIMNDLGGTMRAFSTPLLGIDETTNLIENIHYPYYIVAVGKDSDLTVTTQAVTVPISSIQTGDFVEISISYISTFASGLDTSYNITISNGVSFTVTFKTTDLNNADIIMSYWIMRPIQTTLTGSLSNATEGGIILNLVTNFNEYTDDADLQSVISTTAIPGALVYSNESGFYNFSPDLIVQSSDSILASDGGGVYNPVDRPMVYLNDDNTIGTLSNPYGELAAGFLLAAGTLTRQVSTNQLFINNIILIPGYSLSLSDYVFVTFSQVEDGGLPYTVTIANNGGTIVPVITFSGSSGDAGLVTVSYRIVRAYT